MASTTAIMLRVTILFGILNASLAGVIHYKFHSDFKQIWNDRGSGAELDGSFWHPVNVPPGYYILGHLATQGQNFDRSTITVVVKPESESDLAPPRELFWVYSTNNITIVNPVPPEGYVCLGMLVHTKPEMPTVADFPLFRCVKEEHTTFGGIGDVIWNERGSSGYNFFSWKIVSPDLNSGLPVGGFFAHSSPIPPGDNAVRVLKKSSLGPETDFLSQVTNLLQLHAPNVYFHPEEQYFPDNAEASFNDMTFLYGNVVNNYDRFKREIKGSSPISAYANDVSPLIKQAGRNKYWLGIPESIYPGNLTRSKVYMGAVPRPGRVCLQSAEDCFERVDAFVDLVFFLWYPYNGAGRYKARLSGIQLQGGRLKESGSHQGDWEHFTIRIKKPDYAHDPVIIVDYYVSIHSGGQWVGTKLESDDEGKPVLYSSKHTHAMYASGGDQKYCRPASVDVGLGTFVVELVDETARGLKLRSWENIELVEPNIFGVTQPTPEWFKFTGQFGDYYRITEPVKTLFGITAYTFKSVSSGTSPLRTRSIWREAEITEEVECDR